MRWVVVIVSGRLQVICATVAFGMGINMTSVRFVVHQTLSKSLGEHVPHHNKPPGRQWGKHVLGVFGMLRALRGAKALQAE